MTQTIRDAPTLGSLALSDSVLNLPKVVPSPVVSIHKLSAWQLSSGLMCLFCPCVRGASASCLSAAGSSWTVGRSSTSVLGLFNSADSDGISN